MVTYPRPKVIVKIPIGPIMSFPNNPIGIESEWHVVRRTSVEIPSVLERHTADVVNEYGFWFRKFLIDWENNVSGNWDLDRMRATHRTCMESAFLHLELAFSTNEMNRFTTLDRVVVCLADVVTADRAIGCLNS